MRPPPKPLEEIVHRALELIQPPPDRRESCRTEIGARVDLLRSVHHYLGNLPSPGQLREELGDIVRALKKARATLRDVTPASRSLTFLGSPDEFDAELGRLIRNAEFHREAVHVPSGGRTWDGTKTQAARYADELLRSFGTRPPAKTIGGALYSLAAVLYEGGTGIPDASLEAYCRDLDRVEPSIVVHVPFTD